MPLAEAPTLLKRLQTAISKPRLIETQGLFAAETQMRDAEEKRLEEQLYQGFLDSGDLTKSRDLILEIAG